jgi:arginase
MPLAVALGWCWSTLAATLPGFEPLVEQSVVHLGARAFDEGEEAVLAASDMTLITGEEMQGEQGMARSLEAVSQLGRERRGVHVHLDLDVLDESDGIASGYAVGGGPSLAVLRETIAAIGSEDEVIGLTICSYDPAFDIDGRAAKAGLELLTLLLDAAGKN